LILGGVNMSPGKAINWVHDGRKEEAATLLIKGSTKQIAGAPKKHG